ncbi:MAG: hypothetical protein ACOCVZ_04690, partial [Gemmatimonadota bacterium]
MRPIRWPVLYIVLGSLVVVATVVSQVAPENEIAQRFGPNLATETLGILLTLVFVQRFLERQDRVRRLRSSLGAFRRGSRSLTRMLEAWGTLVKGGLRNPPRYPPDSLLELLEPHNTRAIADIDPALPAADAPAGGWGAWAAAELRTSREALREVVRVYGTSLDAEYVEALDALLDDEFFDVFLELADGGASQDWQVRIRQTTGARDGHFRRLRAVVELHNELAQEAARIRDPRRLPRTRGVGVDLPPDWDLRVHHTAGTNWWKA